MRFALEWARRQGDFRRAELYVYATNLAVMQLYERHGFVMEGRRRGAVRVGNDFVYDVLMAYEVRSDA